MFGYRENGKKITIQSHIWAWRSQMGPIQSGHIVCHTCDTPPCVALEHLYLGTPQSNMDDKVNRGRLVSSPGEANGQAKLTNLQVLAIRDSYAETNPPMSKSAIAQQYGVSASLIGQILRRQIWKTI
jgi:hypothetical protein